jgi:hypothetical protein
MFALLITALIFAMLLENKENDVIGNDTYAVENHNFENTALNKK